MWTLVGAGIKNVNQSSRLMTDVLPQECVLYPQKVAEFDPDNSQVKLANGDVVSLFTWGFTDSPLKCVPAHEKWFQVKPSIHESLFGLVGSLYFNHFLDVMAS